MNKSDPLQGLRAVIQALHPIDEADWQAFAGIWKPFSARRKEIITQAGDTEKHLYFVVEGVQRLYYLDEQEREATLVFTYAPSWGGVLDSFLLQQPSSYYYETLTHSHFLRTSFREWQQIMEDCPQFEVAIKKGLAHTLSGMMKRMVELQCYSSEEKFRQLLSRSPHILQLVPHKYLANYLGIDATNFSKLINKVKI